jgi:hypothetical protein
MRVRLTHATTQVIPTSPERIQQAWAGVPMQMSLDWNFITEASVSELTAVTFPNCDSYEISEIRFSTTPEPPVFPVVTKKRACHAKQKCRLHDKHQMKGLRSPGLRSNLKQTFAFIWRLESLCVGRVHPDNCLARPFASA